MAGKTKTNKKGSLVASGMGLGMGIIEKIQEKIIAHGGSDQDVHFLGTPNADDLINEFAKTVVYCQRTSFEIWKTITIGGPETMEELCAPLKESGHIPEYNYQFVDQVVSLESEETEVHLVNISIRELGFRNGATFTQACARGRVFGLTKCPAEVGIRLRKVYVNQPMNEELIIVMDSIKDYEDRFNRYYVFTVKTKDYGVLLCNYEVSNDIFELPPDTRLIFAYKE